MLHIQISHLSIELLEATPNPLRLTEPQRDTYRLLWAIASVKGDRLSQVRESVILELLQISRPAILYKRLENLERKGLIKMLPEALQA
jgi:hypothetical protein